MIKKLKGQGFYIPMIISMVLLPCFLGYFLKLEYEKEEETRRLERSSTVFTQFFSQIDTIVSNPDKQIDGGFVSVLKGISGDDVSFKLEIHPDTAKPVWKKPHNIDDALEKDQVRFKFESLELRSNDETSEVDTFISLSSEILSDKALPTSGTARYTLETSAREEGQAHLLQKGKDKDSASGIQRKVFTSKPEPKFPEILNKIDRSKGIEVVRLNNEKDESPFFAVVDDEIPIKTILNGILPQILFSVLLLLTMWTAFIMVARSLRRERQLATMRNDFMSNMSHELKTPVSTIGVALEALSSFDAGNNPELRKEYINISKLEVERLGMLVEKALNISLYEQGKFVFDKQNIDINLEIEKILKTLKVQLDNQNVELHYDTRGSNFFINVDKTHMVNVIYNLIENGIKYSPDAAEIDILVSEKQDFVEISIADKGLGIPGEYQDKVFDKFFRVPHGNTHNVKGHGLGLSYVKEAVESQGGRINLNSGVGAGTTFIIRMPKSIKV